MKKYADIKWNKQEFEVGDLVFDCSPTASILWSSVEMSSCHLGFTIHIGAIAYRLKLSDHSLNHSVFHIFLLKKRLGQAMLPPPLPSYHRLIKRAFLS